MEVQFFFYNVIGIAFLESNSIIILNNNYIFNFGG